MKPVPPPEGQRAADEAAVRDFIHQRFVEMFLSQSRRAQLGLLAAAALVAWLWFERSGGSAPLAWIALAGLVTLWRFFWTEAFVRGAGRAHETGRIVAVLALNGVLMALPLVGFAQFSQIGRAAVSIVLLASATASVATTAGFRKVFLAFAAPMLLPLAGAWTLVARDAARPLDALGLAALIVAFLLFLVSIARQNYRVFEESCRIRYGEQQLNRELSSALEQAGEANRAKTQFLAAASHDLRQPIHSMNTLVAALSLRALDARSREIVSLLASVSQSLSAQLDGLLEISRLDAGAVRPNLALHRLDRIAASHHAMFAPLARERGLQYRLTLAADPSVRTDSALLMRVLGNLTENAFKFTPRGGSVEIAVRREGGDALLSVADSGIGIAEAEQERVFLEFYQIGNTERDRSRGLGLGLSIVRRLCSLLGVGVTLASQPGAGTTVTLRLPELASEPPARADPRTGLALPAGLAVLVIDDELQVRESMRLLLDELGCKVLLAEGSEDAARIAASTRLDAVLSDFRLRGDDSGLIALRAVQALQPGVRVALVTGDTAPDRIQDAEAAGIRLLHKPVALADLLAALEPEPAAQGTR
ncbi:MAG: hybrid sensor histidine kinase/response regulator [Burkholderiales bacterium]|nr:hybrid sensor histidine kinase/response regulator [Burkholderiales bacterium]MDE2455073.1 hybrid sensor histidine kinase/response regulator [Burkholderiales bacterium]